MFPVSQDCPLFEGGTGGTFCTFCFFNKNELSYKAMGWVCHEMISIYICYWLMCISYSDESIEYERKSRM